MLFDKNDIEVSLGVETSKVIWMEVEVLFSCKEHADTFNALSPEAKNRIAAYVKCGTSSIKAAKELNLSASNFNKTLRDICKVYFNCTKSEVFSKYAKPVKTDAKAGQLMRLIEKQEYRCALSGVLLSPENAVVDHVMPMSKGGGNSIENLQWVEKEINRMKGELSQEEFLSICNKVARWAS